MHNITKGRIGELVAATKFLENGFDVFQTMVDINGVDFCVIPFNGRQKEILKIQVKSTPSKNKAFRISKQPTPVDFYFFVFTDSEDFYLLPFLEVQKILKKLPKAENIRDAMFHLIPTEWQKFEKFKALSKVVKMRKFSFHAVRTGKIGEKIGIGYFLKNDIEVFEPLCDERAIDCIIKFKKMHYDIQIKFSSNGYQFRNVRKAIPQKNYLFLFIKDNLREYFLLPSDVVWKNSNSSGGFFLTQKMRDKYSGLKYFEKI